MVGQRAKHLRTHDLLDRAALGLHEQRDRTDQGQRQRPVDLHDPPQEQCGADHTHEVDQVGRGPLCERQPQPAPSGDLQDSCTATSLSRQNTTIPSSAPGTPATRTLRSTARPAAAAYCAVLNATFCSGSRRAT